MINHLYNLFVNPTLAWKKIETESYKSNWQILYNNLFFFLVVNPLIFSTINLFFFKSWKAYLIGSLISPFVFTFVGILVIILTALFLEEIYRITSFREPGEIIFKWLVFSFLPLFSLYGFIKIPILGNVFFLTGFIYSFYLLNIGLNKYLWTNKSARRNTFVISSIAGILGFIGIFGIIFILLNALRII